eukprot:1158422-Pelagomonas_calceolata.AAC.8
MRHGLILLKCGLQHSSNNCHVVFCFASHKRVALQGSRCRGTYFLGKWELHGLCTTLESANPIYVTVEAGTHTSEGINGNHMSERKKGHSCVRSKQNGTRITEPHSVMTALESNPKTASRNGSGFHPNKLSTSPGKAKKRHLMAGHREEGFPSSLTSKLARALPSSAE